MSGPSTAWALAAAAVGYATGYKPLPPGITEATVGEWELSVNNSCEQIGDHGPFDIVCKHARYLAIGCFGPAGGLIGGYREADFIEDMKAAMPASEWEALLS